MAAAEPLAITETERRELSLRAGQYTRPYREVIRAKLVLLAADGLSDVQIAENVASTPTYHGVKTVIPVGRRRRG